MLTGWSDKEGNSLCYNPLGVFINPKNDNEWSTYPYNNTQRRAFNLERRFLYSFNKITSHLSRTKRTINQELKLIAENKSTLARHCKDLLIQLTTEYDT